MVVSFADEATEDIYHDRSTLRAQRVPKALWRVIQRKLDMVNAAHAVGDLRAPPGNQPEALRGDRKGLFSIRVNDQFRITFRFEGGDAADVRCEDYH